MIEESLPRVAAVAGGALLIATVIYDIAYSTLSSRGAGPLLRGAALPVWRLLQAVARRASSQKVLGLTGPCVVLAGFTVWILSLWLGWTLVFLGDADAVVVAQTGEPATWLERLYYAGFCITTLGVGDYVAQGWPWQFATVLASLSGFSALTLSITFLLSLLSAVADKRAVADFIWSLGGTPQGLITESGWNGSAARLLTYVPDLSKSLSSLAQQYTAYPLLQYYHATEPRAALSLRLAALSEALLYLESGAVADAETAAGIRPLRRSIHSLLATLHRVYLPRPDREPPPPELGALDERVAVEPKADLLGAAQAQERHRRLLLAFVERDGWSWSDVSRDYQH